MVLRLLMRYLANNENLVNKIADSRPVRRAARFVVYLLSRTSQLSGSNSLPSNSKELGYQIINAFRRFSTDFKKELKNAQEEVKRKQSKKK